MLPGKLWQTPGPALSGRNRNLADDVRLCAGTRETEYLLIAFANRGVDRKFQFHRFVEFRVELDLAGFAVNGAF